MTTPPEILEFEEDEDPEMGLDLVEEGGDRKPTATDVGDGDDPEAVTQQLQQLKIDEPPLVHKERIPKQNRKIRETPRGNPPGRFEEILANIRRKNARDVGLTGEESSIVFQMNVIDYVCACTKTSKLAQIPPFPGRDCFTQRPVIRMFGDTADGLSVLARIYGYEPHFYCDAPMINPVLANNKEWLQLVTDDLNYRAWNTVLNERGKPGHKRYFEKKKQKFGGRDMSASIQCDEDECTLMEGPMVVRVEVVQKIPIRGYHTEKTPFLLVVTRLPKHVPTVRKILENKSKLDRFCWCSEWEPNFFKTYEADVPFDLRHMIDKEIVGCSWVSIERNGQHDISTMSESDAKTCFPAFVRYHCSDELHMGGAKSWIDCRKELARRLKEQKRTMFIRGVMTGESSGAKQQLPDDESLEYIEVPEDDTEYRNSECDRDLVDHLMQAADDESRCQIEIDVWYRDVKSLGIQGEWAKHAPPRLLSFDIECAARHPGFPSAKGGDPVITIGSILWCDEVSPTTALVNKLPRMLRENKEGEVVVEEGDISVIFQLGTCSDMTTQGDYLVTFDDEASLIMAWQQLIVTYNPDVITGFNTPNFDFPYLFERAETLGIGNRFKDMSRIRGELACIKNSQFNSRGTGVLENKEVKITGRFIHDIRQVAQRTLKLKTYSLRSVGAVIDMEKIDVDHREIPKIQFEGTPDDRLRLVIYNKNDALIPSDYARKRMVEVNSVEMARATGIQQSYEMTRGQQIKVQSLILRESAKIDVIVDSARPRGEVSAAELGGKYQGATVITPKKGIHLLVVTMDFNSLYPSIMISGNMCYSTMLTEEQGKKFNAKKVWRSPDPANVLFIQAPAQFPAKDAEELKLQVGADFYIGSNGQASLFGGRTYALNVATKLKLKEHADYELVNGSTDMIVTDSEKKFGILSVVLNGLLSARKAAKFALSKEKDPFRKAVLDGRQLALKISANSVYGFTGTETGKLPAKEIASSVTARGRELIMLTKEVVTREFSIPKGCTANSEVIYGDSVTGDTALFVITRGKLAVVCINEIDGEWKPYGDCGKEAIAMGESELFVWSDDYFVPVLRVIRHRTSKPIYRVVTNQGIVDCTGDHSLLRSDGVEVKTTDVSAGDKLLYTELNDVQYTRRELLEMVVPLMRGEVIPDSETWKKVVTSRQLYMQFKAHKSIEFTCTGPRLALHMIFQEYCGPPEEGATVLAVLVRTNLPTVNLVYDLETASHHFHVGPGNLVVHNTDSVMVKFHSDAPLGADAAELAGNGIVEYFSKMLFKVEKPITRAACALQFTTTWKCICSTNSKVSTNGIAKKTAPPIVPPSPAGGGRAQIVDAMTKSCYESFVANCKAGCVDRIKQAVVRLTKEHISGQYGDHREYYRRTKPTDDTTELVKESLECMQVCVRDVLSKLFTYIEVVEHQHVGIGILPDSFETLVAEVMESARLELMFHMVTLDSDHGRKACDMVTSVLPKPLKIEFEKAYWSYLLIAKKRYAGLKWVFSDALKKMVMEQYLSFMGMETVRRDGCELQRSTLTQAANQLLIKDSVEGSIAVVRKVISEFLTRDITIDRLIITKALSKSQTPFSTKQPHVNLANRLKRDGIADYGLGDRVPYVVIQSTKKVKMCDKSEDPMIAIREGIPPDKDYYITKQIGKSITRLLAPIIPDHVQQVFNLDVPIKEIMSGNTTTAAQKKRDTHVKQKVVAAPPSTAPGKIGKFLVFVGKQCVNCGCVIKISPTRTQVAAICDYCKRHYDELMLLPRDKLTPEQVQYIEKLDSLPRKVQRDIEEVEERLQQHSLHCKLCQDDRHVNVVCSNSECPMTYAKIHLEKKLKDTREIAARF
jgi:DNA polymerase elongation subunit (family B)